MTTENKADDTNVERILSVYLAEYEALKAEQLGRINVRDNLIYTTVGAVGAIGAVALGGVGDANIKIPDLFLLVPWVTTVLGWTYLVNDEKITGIRDYLDTRLAEKIRKLSALDDHPLQWEHVHREGDPHVFRKSLQLVIDLLTFVGAGLAALVAYVAEKGLAQLEKAGLFFVGLEALVLFALAARFAQHFYKAIHRRESQIVSR